MVRRNTVAILKSEMPPVSLSTITAYCDRLLRTGQFEDYPGAVNGLQVQNHGSVTRIGAAVDGTLATIKMAVAQKVDLLLVHHGLFWSPSHPWTGKKWELITSLIKNNLALYSSHLPLDAHPKVGNNIVLCNELGFKKTRPFFMSHGQRIGRLAIANISRGQLLKRLGQATGTKPLMIPSGPAICRRIGIVTGGAGGGLEQAAKEGADTFITGEGPHWTYARAEELGLNVFYAGHYATETFGVKALAAHLSRRFRLSWVFLDYPTGL